MFIGCGYLPATNRLLNGLYSLSLRIVVIFWWYDSCSRVSVRVREIVIIENGAQTKNVLKDNVTL